MVTQIQILDAQGNAWFIGKRDLPSEQMLKFASDRLPGAKQQGMEMMQGAVPAYAKNLAEVAKNGGSEDDIDKAVMNLVMMTLVLELWMGVDETTLANRDLNFVINADGSVRYDRLEAQAS